MIDISKFKFVNAVAHDDLLAYKYSEIFRKLTPNHDAVSKAQLDKMCLAMVGLEDKTGILMTDGSMLIVDDSKHQFYIIDVQSVIICVLSQTLDTGKSNEPYQSSC